MTEIRGKEGGTSALSAGVPFFLRAAVFGQMLDQSIDLFFRVIEVRGGSQPLLAQCDFGFVIAAEVAEDLVMIVGR